MKTTLDLDDDLLARAKAAAARERKTLTRMIEEGLALRLRRRTGAAAKFSPTIPVFRGGGAMRQGVDPCSNQSMLDACDDNG